MTVYNSFLENALISKNDENGNEKYKCNYQHTTKFYFNSKKLNKEYIDVDETLYLDDVSAFCSDLKKAGVSKFTYSLEYDQSQTIAMYFESNGFNLVDLVYFDVYEDNFSDLDKNGNPTSEKSQIHKVIKKRVPTFLFSS